jgi:hypothetical protein
MEIETIYQLIEVLLLIPFLFEINQRVLRFIKSEYEFLSLRKMNLLFFYHLFFSVIYYCYSSSNPSDSKQYFLRVSESEKSWAGNFGLETSFIDFISFPFINNLGFSYEMMMLLFTWIGYWGFVLGFLFFKENIPHKVKVFKRVDLLTLILFLPNMHFWSASFGKGALIFFGVMLFAHSFVSPFKRIWGLIIASLLVFAIRPHMFLLLCIGSLYGLFFGKNLISYKRKIVTAGIIIFSLLILQDKILAVVNLQYSSNILSDFLAFANKRSSDLSSATSGIDMSNHSLPERIFTFWFRPLFFDAPGILGIIVSIENFIYLILFSKLLKSNFFRFWKNAPTSVKASLMIFVITSFAMTFIMSNLGIMLRQKTMIMYFMFFVIYYFLAYQNSEELRSKLDAINFKKGNNLLPLS